MAATVASPPLFSVAPRVRTPSPTTAGPLLGFRKAPPRGLGRRRPASTGNLVGRTCATPPRPQARHLKQQGASPRSVYRFALDERFVLAEHESYLDRVVGDARKASLPGVAAAAALPAVGGSAPPLRKKAVSFDRAISALEIPRVDARDASSCWWHRSDYDAFARGEVARRRRLSIASSRMLTTYDVATLEDAPSLAADLEAYATSAYESACAYLFPAKDPAPPAGDWYIGDDRVE
mmetsp:Transcript_7575/g.23919  ORF Transcript_7575/g.23919 Transcript_7575/m.23919 type:complete len:236 (+) Transcript_7575:215-922(+)